MYASPTMLGTRPSGTIAAAWAALMSQGVEGYRKRVRQTIQLAEKAQAGLAALGLNLLGDPVTGVFAVSSDRYDLLLAAEGMAEKNWWLDCLNNPPCLHFIITPNHARSLDEFLTDLTRVLPRCRAGDDPCQTKRAVLYGMTSDINAVGDPEARLLNGLLDSYRPESDLSGSR